MASTIKVDKLDPQSGTALEIGTSGDTVTLPSGVTLTTTNATVNLPASVGGLGTGITNAQLAGSIDVTTKITGVVPTANLGSGSASSSTFLRGDQTYAAAGGAFESNLLHITHEAADDTNGGDSTSGSWQKRTINTINTNEISATLTSDVIALGAGTYYTQCNATFSNSSYLQLRLRDTTNSTTLVVGGNVHMTTAATSLVMGRFTLSGTVNIELQYYSTSGYATTGQGYASPPSGEVNRWVNVQIWKI